MNTSVEPQVKLNQALKWTSGSPSSQGVSRSASVVISYLMWRDGDNYENTFRLVKEKRGIANPNMVGGLYKLNSVDPLLESTRCQPLSL